MADITKQYSAYVGRVAVELRERFLEVDRQPDDEIDAGCDPVSEFQDVVDAYFAGRPPQVRDRFFREDGAEVLLALFYWEQQRHERVS
jgi:hypothetical protein